MTHSPGPRLTLNPADAAHFGVESDGLVRIESAHGEAILRAHIDGAVRAGDVFVPMHWTDEFSSAGPVDRLVHALTDSISGQPDLKGTKVRVLPLQELWRGFLLRGAAGAPPFDKALHWSKAPIAGGFAYDLSGLAPLGTLVDSEDALRRLLHVPAEAELISYSDPARSVFRYAGLVGERLEACVFFAGPGAGFPEADYAIGLIGQPLGAVARLTLLAGLDAGQGAKDETVCACFGVGREAILRAIRAKNLTTPAEIGASLRAGTNCGSCIPELKALLTKGASRVSEAA
jgi:assimilatory nitrate reductase catalytic subunit